MAVIITDIIGAIIILVGIQQMAKGKLNKNNAITVCLSITIIPILLLLIFYVFTAVLIRGTAPFSFDYLSLAILNVELIMVVFYLLSKCFSLPYSRLSQDADASKNAVSIDRVIKMLYCFYVDKCRCSSMVERGTHKPQTMVRFHPSTQHERLK